jgi:hypothetical protein
MWTGFNFFKDKVKWWAYVITVTSDNVLQRYEIY